MTVTIESQAMHLHRRAAAVAAPASRPVGGGWSRSTVLASLLSVKTGGCPEDCGYCPQSRHHPTGMPATKLMGEDEVLTAARNAEAAGASRICMGAAWCSPTDRDVDKTAGLIAELANLNPAPESVPVNNLVRAQGTPLAGNEPVDTLEVVRVIAAANSIFYGDMLLVTSELHRMSAPGAV